MFIFARDYELTVSKWGGQTKSWSSGDVIGVLVTGVILIILFCVLSYFQQERSLLPPRIFTMRHIWVNMAFIFFFSGSFFVTVYYLPIYFQVVSGVNASQSGIRNLPVIIAMVIFTIFSGGLISKTGHYLAWIVLAGIFSTVGSGLIYTLQEHSPSSKWIGYQVVSGIGYGCGIQLAIIVGQSLSDPSDLTAVTAAMLTAQTLGGAIWIGAAEAAFTNTILNKLPFTAPSIDPKSIINIGVTDIRTVFPPDVVPGVIQAYLDGVHVNFALSIALAGVAFCFSLASKRVNLTPQAAVGGAV